MPGSGLRRRSHRGIRSARGAGPGQGIRALRLASPDSQRTTSRLLRSGCDVPNRSMWFARASATTRPRWPRMREFDHGNVAAAPRPIEPGRLRGHDQLAGVGSPGGRPPKVRLRPSGVLVRRQVGVARLSGDRRACRPLGDLRAHPIRSGATGFAALGWWCATTPPDIPGAANPTGGGSPERRSHGRAAYWVCQAEAVGGGCGTRSVRVAAVPEGPTPCRKAGEAVVRPVRPARSRRADGRSRPL